MRPRLHDVSAKWLVTGAAGFIGSHLVEQLLRRGQEVIGLDNFATGHRENLELIQGAVSSDAWARFRFVEGDIRDLEVCKRSMDGADYVLHQAALGSVPRSLIDPVASHAVNVTGHLHILWAAHSVGIRSLVYAASSSTYGDHPALPKREDVIGDPLSPYAVTKLTNEHYAKVFHRAYGVNVIGLRYFNVYGPRQDPNGAYAAVIPRWIQAGLAGQPLKVNGDGETSRDFCFVDNVVAANLLAATASAPCFGEVYNIGCGDRTSLNELIEQLRVELRERHGIDDVAVEHGPEREGDVRHSLASIEKAATRLGYEPSVRIREGLEATIRWFARRPRAQ